MFHSLFVLIVKISGSKIILSRVYLLRLLAVITLLQIFPEASFANSRQIKLNKGKEEYSVFFRGEYNGGNFKSEAQKPRTKPRDAFCGFISQDIKDYIKPEKVLDLKKFLSGELEVFGVACDYSRSIRETFYIDIKAVWSGDQGHLDEQMYYESGKEEKRVWDYKLQDNQNYTATGTNVVGVAQGKKVGNTANMKYRFITPYGFIKLHLSMDDNWFLIDQNTAVNRIFMKKFGMKVGEVMMIVKKKEGEKNVKKHK